MTADENQSPDRMQYLGSVALTLLCDLAARVKSGKGTIKICCASPDTDTFLQMTGAAKLFEIYPDQRTALSLFSSR